MCLVDKVTKQNLISMHIQCLLILCMLFGFILFNKAHCDTLHCIFHLLVLQKNTGIYFSSLNYSANVTIITCI